jgi:hypothetical protein
MKEPEGVSRSGSGKVGRMGVSKRHYRGGTLRRRGNRHHPKELFGATVAIFQNASAALTRKGTSGLG